jgi:hypothetical protein
MDVIVFLLTSVGSSTVRLLDSIGSRRACACSELVSVVKMATVLEEYTNEEQRYVVWFLWGKGLNAKDIHKEIYPLYDGKCLSCKAFTTGRQAFRWRGRGSNVGAEVAEKVNRLLCCGFRLSGQAMGQVHQCWWICREINGFPQVRTSHVLHLIFICELFTDFPS